jgi:glycosyltransferase involved in cell wall biosynthesis
MPITSRINYSGIPNHVVCVSHFVANYLISEGVPAEQVTTVLTGINFDNYRVEGDRSGLRNELGIPSDSLLIGTIAILRFKKGHADLLAAIPKVLESVDAHFVFAGNGPMYETIQAQVATMGLQNRVHLLGLRRDVVEILRSIDLFVLPTHQEALGTAFVEAGAMGRPSIGTRVDGVPEVIIDQETGILVPPHDSRALAEAILTMASSREKRQKMGAAAYTHVRKLFSRKAMAQGMVSVYSDLLGLK